MSHADIDPELSMRVKALSDESRGLTLSGWNSSRSRALYDEADHLAERAQQAGLGDLSEALLGQAAYLSSFADSSFRPNELQLEQVRTLADAVADALTHCLAQIEVAELSPGPRQTEPLLPAIYYFGFDMEHLELLHVRLSLLGYQIGTCADVADVERVLEGDLALALVLSDDALPVWLAQHQTREGGSTSARVPLVVLSNQDDINVRLAAMRCAAEAVFVLPEDAERIAPRLAGLIADRAEPYCVLIVDDDQSMRMFADSVLRHNGMQTCVAATPEDALAALRDFSPDVILADLYMPQISGFELLALFRAHPRTAFIPVVLLSGDNDAEKRFAALHIGGDDYLTKPIRPRHLVAAVSSRARRARWLRRELMLMR
jgi:DNA-binding response OmpR family regulator